MVVTAVALVSIFATGCAPLNAPSNAKPLQNSNALSAKQVAQDYYQSIEQHDVSAAAQFLAPDLASLYRSSPDSDFHNVQSLSNVTVSNPNNIRLDSKYKYEVQVTANYTAQYKQEVTEPNGGQTRFIYLGRNSQQAQWLIISIGTGP